MVSTVIRLPEELLKAITESARKNKRSRNSEMLVALESYLEQQQKQPADQEGEEESRPN